MVNFALKIAGDSGEGKIHLKIHWERQDSLQKALETAEDAKVT